MSKIIIYLIKQSFLMVIFGIAFYSINKQKIHAICLFINRQIQTYTICILPIL